MMKKIILWDRDDVLDDEDEDEKEVIQDIDEDDDEDNDELASNEAEITNEDGRKIRVKMPKSQEVIHTNFGSFLAHHPDNPYNTREIYIAHTNFDITEEHIKHICRVPGVEAFRAITRYSFTIIVGMIFYDADVLSEIDRICGVEPENLLSDKTQQKVDNNQEIIDSTISAIKGDFWYCYIMPNGETVVEEYLDQESMDIRQPFFIALNNISEGLLLNSRSKEDDE